VKTLSNGIGFRKLMFVGIFGFRKLSSHAQNFSPEQCATGLQLYVRTAHTPRRSKRSRESVDVRFRRRSRRMNAARCRVLVVSFWSIVVSFRGTVIVHSWSTVVSSRDIIIPISLHVQNSRTVHLHNEFHSTTPVCKSWVRGYPIRHIVFPRCSR